MNRDAQAGLTLFLKQPPEMINVELGYGVIGTIIVTQIALSLIISNYESTGFSRKERSKRR